MTIRERAAAAVAATCLALGGLVLVPGTASAASTSCKRDHEVLRCVTFSTPVVRKYKQRYEDGVRNTNGKGVKLFCTNDVTKTTKFGVTASVSGQIKTLIFGKLEVTVSGNIEHSVATRYGSQVQVDVPARHRASCKYGTYYYSVKGYSVTTVHGKTVERKSWTATVPSKNHWVVATSRL